MLKKILLIALISAIALFAALYLFGSKILNALKQAIQSGLPWLPNAKWLSTDWNFHYFPGKVRYTALP